MITKLTPQALLGVCQFPRFCLSASVCRCVYVCVFKALCSAPEIEASPVDEPAQSSVPSSLLYTSKKKKKKIKKEDIWVVLAADRQHLTYFPA